jgi:ferredoxin-type protein NapF
VDITVIDRPARIHALSTMDMNRRRFLTANPGIPELRPPWLLNPSTFTDSCTRCLKCVELCPQDILVAGGGGYPRVDFARGECTFCGDCTGACEADLFHNNLDNIDTGWLHKAAIGKRCLTHFGVMCRSCEDACEAQAIRFTLTAGKVPQPVVDTGACSGCGACVSPCPEDAISMVAAGSPL